MGKCTLVEKTIRFFITKAVKLANLESKGTLQ